LKEEALDASESLVWKHYLPNGVSEVLPDLGEREELHVARFGRFPDEKVFLAHLAKGEQEDAALELAKVLADEESGHKVLRPPWESAAWISVRSLARSRLLELEPAGRAAYRKLKDDDAIPRFEAASRIGNAHELEELLDRYPAVTPAAAAAVQAGDLFLEAGELRSARRAWARARHDYPDEVDAGALDLRIERAGLLEKSFHRQPIHEARAPSAAAAALGGKSSPEAPHLRLLWRRPVRAPAPGTASFLPAALACAHEGAVFVQEESGALAIELETGRLMWRTPLEREIAFLDDAAPAAVAVGDTVVVVRGRRIAWVLERSTGRVTGRIHVVKDLGGANGDRIDAVASERGRIFVAATISGDRVLAAFDRSGGRLFQTPLWAGASLDASLLLGPEGVFILADNGIASLDRTGSIRWLRGGRIFVPGPGRSPERTLARAGDHLAILSPEGTTLLDPETGERATLPAVPRSVLVLACGDDGPIFVNPAPPAGNPPILVPAGRMVLIPRRLEPDALPLWPGVIARGSLVLPSAEALVAVDLASGAETRCRAPAGRLAASGDAIVVSREDEVLAFAPRAPARPPRPLPADVRGVCQRLASTDWREREAARAKLRELGAAAEAALKEVVEEPGASPEAREVARHLLKGLSLRSLWEKAFAELRAAGLGLRSPELAEEAADLEKKLVSSRAGSRLAALRTIGAQESATKGGIKATPSLLAVLRLAAQGDDDIAVRTEALSLLARYDATVRAALRSVLLGKREEGRDAAASVLVGSGAAAPGSRGHAILEEALASDRDDVRSLVYRALLQDGGPRGRSMVTDHIVDPGAVRGRKASDPMAEIELRAFDLRNPPVNTPPKPGADQAAEAAARHMDDDRRVLLERVPIGD
jgi:hypothetical protein